MYLWSKFCQLEVIEIYQNNTLWSWVKLSGNGNLILDRAHRYYIQIWDRITGRWDNNPVISTGTIYTLKDVTDIDLVTVCIYLIPLLQIGWSTRSIFKWSTACLHSEFSFSWTSCLTKSREREEKHKQFCPGFELGSPILFFYDDYSYFFFFKIHEPFCNKVVMVRFGFFV